MPLRDLFRGGREPEDDDAAPAPGGSPPPPPDAAAETPRTSAMPPPPPARRADAGDDLFGTRPGDDPPAPDRADGAPDGDGAAGEAPGQTDAAPDDAALDDAAASPARPDVPVELGAVDDEDHDRAVRRAVSRALAEDLGDRGDVTSYATVPVGTRGVAALVARESGVVAGLACVAEVVRQVDARIEVELLVEDGARVGVGDHVARLTGPLRTLLTAERTLLNLVCQLSGVATQTAAFVEALAGTGCAVRDTRKTTPGLRLLEKRAVAAGGGANHRVGLYDAVLVKDNHVAAAGGVGAAARAALDGAPEGVHVQVEVTSLAGAEDAIAEGVTDLLLDNFSPTELRAAVDAIAGRAAVEASGGITLATARDYAEAGADRLAVGALTHSAPALDLALDVEQVDRSATIGARLAIGADPRADEPAGDDAAGDDAEDQGTADEGVAADEMGDVDPPSPDPGEGEAPDEQDDDAAAVGDAGPEDVDASPDGGTSPPPPGDHEEWGDPNEQDPQWRTPGGWG